MSLIAVFLIPITQLRDRLVNPFARHLQFLQQEKPNLNIYFAFQQLTFIMKVQNIEDVRSQLFNEQVKLTHKMRIKKEHFLLKIPLFDLIYQKKGDQNFQVILAHIKLVKAQFGEIIFQNQDERTFNFIVRGSIMLFTRTKIDEKREQPKLFRRLEAGEHFGEKMQYGREEVESFRAATTTYLLQLPMSVFYNTFAGHFKYDELRDKINFLKSIWIFSQVKRTMLERILLSNECKKFTRNTVLCREGEVPEHLIVILEGELTLNITKQGKAKAFCVLGKSEVCGIEEIVEERPYEYTAICTSDYAQILKVEKEAIIGIVDRDVKPQILRKRKQVAIELKNKNLDSNKLAIYSQKQLQLNGLPEPQTFSHRRRYKSEGGHPSIDQKQPINKIKVLNELFNREVQLKQSQLRRYKLQQIEQTNKNLYSVNRISTYTNGSCTYDKEIIIKYLGRKQRKYQDILRKERQFIERKMVAVVPELRVERSSAVKNQKRKLKCSRKMLYSTLEIYE